MNIILYALVGWTCLGLAMIAFFLLWFRFGKRFKEDREKLKTPTTFKRANELKHQDPYFDLYEDEIV